MKKTLPDTSKSRNTGEGLSLAQKGAILIALPMIFQLSLLFLWLKVHDKMNSLAYAMGLERDSSDCRSGLIHASIAIDERVGEAIASGHPLDPASFRDLKLSTDYSERLKEMSGPSSPEGKLAGEITTCSRYLIEHAKEAQSLSKYDGKSLAEKAPTLRKINETRDLLRRELFAFSRFGLQTMDMQAQLELRRTFVLIISGGTIINTALILLIWLFLNKEIISRLEMIISNSIWLGLGRQLQPALPGSDEIARLDRAFHDMADKLVETSRKQKSLIDNAKDVLCVLNKSGEIISINESARTLWGFEPGELTGKSLKSILSSACGSQTIEILSEMCKSPNNTQSSFEMEVVRKDKSVAAILFSATWSNEDKNLVCVAHDISERKAAERQRDELLQMVSHDLRNPLTAIITFYTILETDMLGPLSSQGRKALLRAEAFCKHMLKLINSLLDISKIEAGMLRLDFTETNISDILADVVKNTNEIARQKQIVLSVDETSQDLFGDADRLKQSIKYILHFAVESSTAGSELTVRSQTEEGNLRIYITASGIKNKLSAAIFDRFHRNPEEIDPRYQLELSVAKALIELHGGNILLNFDSTTGNIFLLEIPVKNLKHKNSSTQ